MYKSNIASHLSAKYTTLIVGLFLLLLGIKELIVPAETVVFNGVEQEGSSVLGLFLIIPGIVLLLIFNYFGRRVIRLSINEDILEFTFNWEQRTYNWADVATIRKLWYTAPLLYSIRFKNDKTLYYFTTGMFNIVILFYTIDLSNMGKLVSKKRMEVANRTG